MTKEKLLQKKREIFETNGENKIIDLSRVCFTDDRLRKFSVNQLEEIKEILFQLNEKCNETTSFEPLSANEVYHKPSGRVAIFEEEIREESEEEIMRSASRGIYKKIKGLS